MSCEICGKNNCLRSFHSFDEQEEFDNAIDRIKDKLFNHIKVKLNRLNYRIMDDGVVYIKLDDVFNIIDSY